MGNIGGSEGAAIIINEARRFLKDPSAMLPQRSVTKIAGISLPQSRFEYAFSELAARYVEKIFNQVGYKFDLRLCLKGLPEDAVLTTTGIFEDLNFTANVPLESEHITNLYVERGQSYGFNRMA